MIQRLPLMAFVVGARATPSRCSRPAGEQSCLASERGSAQQATPGSAQEPSGTETTRAVVAAPRRELQGRCRALHGPPQKTGTALNEVVRFRTEHTSKIPKEAVSAVATLSSMRAPTDAQGDAA